MFPVEPASDCQRVSVIIPMYKAMPFIAEALASIQQQTLEVASIIAVEDGHWDGSADFVSGFPKAQVMRKEHSGLSETLNAGLGAVQTELVAFLDQDDRWLPSKLQLQVAAMKADPQLDMVFGQAERFISSGGVDRILDVLPGVAKSGGLFRTAVFSRVGNFGAGHDFVDWFARAKEAGCTHRVLPETVYQRRIHENSMGAVGKAAQTKSYFTSLKAALDRRRAAGGPA